MLPFSPLEFSSGAYQYDRITGTVIGIDYGHHEIHEGSSFTAQYRITTAATNGHRSGLYFRTPVGPKKLVHIVVSFSCSTGATYSICEAPTIAANTGTHNNVIYNRYRDSIKVSECRDNANAPAANRFTTLTEAQIAADGTWNVGTVIRSAPLTVGTAPNSAGGASRETQEYILKADTKYVFLLTNTAASANAHAILVDWYEHTNKV